MVASYIDIDELVYKNKETCTVSIRDYCQSPALSILRYWEAKKPAKKFRVTITVLIILYFTSSLPPSLASCFLFLVPSSYNVLPRSLSLSPFLLPPHLPSSYHISACCSNHHQLGIKLHTVGGAWVSSVQHSDPLACICRPHMYCTIL